MEYHWEYLIGFLCGIGLAYIIDIKFNKGRITCIWKQILFSKRKNK